MYNWVRESQWLTKPLVVTIPGGWGLFQNCCLLCYMGKNHSTVFCPFLKMYESESFSVMSNSLWPHGLYSSWNSPGQNIGVCSLSLLCCLLELLKFMSIESVMLFNPTFPFALNLSQHQGLFQWTGSWPKYWSFSFSISPSNEYSELISFRIYLYIPWTSLVVQLVRSLPVMQETWVRSLVWEDPLEKGKVTHSSFLA